MFIELTIWESDRKVFINPDKIASLFVSDTAHGRPKTLVEYGGSAPWTVAEAPGEIIERIKKAK